MKANVIHTSLNPRGGSERLSICTIKALSDMGYEVDLTTFEKTELDKLEETYNYGIRNLINKENTLKVTWPVAHSTAPYDIVINTHGDVLPYFEKGFSATNAVTFCHFPLCNYLVESMDPDYLDSLYALASKSANNPSQFHDLHQASEAYGMMMRNSTVLTNSRFSKKAIFKTFGVDSTILYPPVDVKVFRDYALKSDERENSVLVISRFHPSKKIENAIHLARLLEERHSVSGITIVGNLPPEQIGYYNYLRHLVDKYGLNGYVNFKINVPFSDLLHLISKSSVYFHPLPGEPFGISTVEAMGSGLVPVVSHIGGHAEFVPPEYQFQNFDDAALIIEKALDIPFSERVSISYSAQRFSSQNYSASLKRIITELLSARSEVVTARLQKKNLAATE